MATEHHITLHGFFVRDPDGTYHAAHGLNHLYFHLGADDVNCKADVCDLIKAGGSFTYNGFRVTPTKGAAS